MSARHYTTIKKQKINRLQGLRLQGDSIDYNKPRKTAINTGINFENRWASQSQSQSQIPVTILGSQTPQELAYSILTSDKAYFSKQEVLLIIGKLDSMLNNKFETECSYIS